jgi:hypothetical protein
LQQAGDRKVLIGHMTHDALDLLRRLITAIELSAVHDGGQLPREQENIRRKPMAGSFMNERLLLAMADMRESD